MTQQKRQFVVKCEVNSKSKLFAVPSCRIVSGVSCITLCILTFIWTPYDLVMDERIRMRPGLPAFEWWSAPAQDGTLSIYIYNVTNAERFLSGEDPKLLLEEVGPINFQQPWRHQDIVFNDNGTMTYSVNKSVVFHEKDNKNINLNDTIVMPNMAVLLSLSYVWNQPGFIKFGLNSLLDYLDSKPIITTTIYNFLYNNTDPFLELVHNVVPSIAPYANIGVIPMLYNDPPDRVTAYIGTKYGHELFSLIENYRGSTNTPGQGDSCKFKITNASEGIIFNQKISKDTVLKYYNKQLCRVVPLIFQHEATINGFKAYKFSISEHEFSRIEPLEDDCYSSYPSLPNGLTDISKCFSTFPLVVSYVYLNFTDDSVKSCAEVLKPNNRTKELPYTYVEPVSGIPIISSAPIQTNLYIRPLRGFNKIFKRFSNKIVPVFWLEYHNEVLPFKVICMMKFTLALPTIGWILRVVLLIIGIYYIYKFSGKIIVEEEMQNTPIVELGQTITSEQETFVKTEKSNFMNKMLNVFEKNH